MCDLTRLVVGFFCLAMVIGAYAITRALMARSLDAAVARRRALSESEEGRERLEREAERRRRRSVALRPLMNVLILIASACLILVGISGIILCVGELRGGIPPTEILSRNNGMLLATPFAGAYGVILMVRFFKTIIARRRS